MVNYKIDQQKNLSDWWQSPLGQEVFSQEHLLLQSLNSYFYGYYQLQLGTKTSLLPQTSKPKLQLIMASEADLEGDNENLPFKCHTIDTLLLSHVLEFSDDPHQILREAERVLIADGTLVLCCFNPWSLWGLRRLFSWQDKPPWYGHFFSQTRIKDWLALLNFDIIATEKYLFTLPLKSKQWLNRLTPLERWGKRLWPLFPGATILVASKRTIPLTPITQSWRARSFFPAGRLVNKPVSREKTNE